MIWLENLSELTIPNFIPNNYMKFEEKLNTIIRLVLLIGIVSMLIFNDSKYILFSLIIMILSILLYNHYYENNLQTEKYLNKNNLGFIDNKVCIKPTENNPFMNPNLTDIGDDMGTIKTCSIENIEVQKSMKDIFYSKIFRDSDDIYDKNPLERQFYTVPSTTIPNDMNLLGEWLYERGPTCKENNGIRCYNNQFHDVRKSSHL